MIHAHTHAHAPRPSRTGSHAVQLALIALIALTGGLLLQCAAPATSDAARVTQRRAVSAPTIRRYIIPVRAVFHGNQIATWYGPGFWGHRTGCGTTLRTSTWGIAHRTLPCGTLVQLQQGSRRIAVPVIDRGPYSGASIDLTRRTADALRFRQSSSNRVRMTIIKRYHFVPLHRR